MDEVARELVEEAERAWGEVRRLRQENDDMRQCLQAALIYLSEFPRMVQSEHPHLANDVRFLIARIAKLGGKS